MIHKCWRYKVTLVVVWALTLSAQYVPRTKGKPTEEVVKQYELLIADGAFLTPEGWKRGKKLFASDVPFPADKTIHLTSTGGLIGEDWVRGDEAQVETKWTDSYGTIDSALRYHPAYRGFDSILTVFIFRLVRVGGKEWRIAEPSSVRWATPERAIDYVSAERDRSTNPQTKKNAEKTLRILKQLRHPCGTASAC